MRRDRALGLAFLLGAAAGGLAAWTVRPRESPGPVLGGEVSASDGSESRPAPPVPCEPPPPGVLERMAPPEVHVAAKGWGAPFESGTVVVRLGDGYVFGEDRARPGAEPETVDFVCDDIGAVVSLHCPHGARAPSVPLGAVGVPDRADKVAILLVDAPPEMPQRRASFSETASAPRVTGLALVKAGSGTVYKVWLLEVLRDASALRRAARFGYGPVPVVPDGGVLRVATTKPLDGAAAPTDATVADLVAAGAMIPGSSFANFLSGSYARLAAPTEPLVVKDRRYLLLEGRLRSSIRLEREGAVYAQDGIDPEGEVVLTSYGAVAVRGAMAGKISVESYGYVHIAGDLTGELDCRRDATVVIDGDIRGTLKLNSYVSLLLRGNITGTLDPRRACWSTMYWQGFHTKQSVAELPGSFRQVTLHLEQSDAPAGKLDPPPGTFREVFVGDPVWAKLRR